MILHSYVCFASALQKAQLLEEGRRQSQAAGPLAALDCSVCLTRPIQVGAVERSHADDI